MVIGQKNKYWVDVYMGVVIGQKFGNFMCQLFGFYKFEIYQYYKSYICNKIDFVVGMEEKVDDCVNVFKYLFIKYGVLVLVLIMVLGVWKVVVYFILEEYMDEIKSGIGIEVCIQQVNGQKFISVMKSVQIV